MIVQGLGFEDVLIRGLSGRRFLAFFKNVVDLKEVDLDFLRVGFEEVKLVELKDLIPTRKIWLECRGLPMQAWTEDNFIKILSKWGDIIHFATVLDDENFYLNPRFHVETSSIHKIDSLEKIIIEGSEWEIRVLEIEANDITLSDPQRFWSPQSRSVSKPVNSGIQQQNCFSGSEFSAKENKEGTLDLPPDYSKLKVENSGKKSESLSSNEFINPVTPPEQSKQAFSEEVKNENHIWKTREDSECSNSEVKSEISLVKTWLEDSIGDDLANKCLSNPSLVSAMQSLMLKSKRGRPRKGMTRKENKFFKLPKLRKNRTYSGFKLADIDPMGFFKDEARNFYETGILLGLIPDYEE